MPNRPDDIDPALAQLIVTYLHARDVWLATAALGGDLLSEGDRFEALEEVSHAFLRFPCLTLAAVRRKISFTLDVPELCAMVREDGDGAEDLLRIFLLSLIAQIPESEPRL